MEKKSSYKKDKIEILDKERKTKAIYTLKKEVHLEGYEEEREYNSYLELFLYLFGKVLQFGLYVIVNFFKLFINLLEGLFLKNYQPFKPIQDAYTKKQDEKAKNYLMKNTKPHATVTHQYEFIRNKVFARNYYKINNFLNNVVKHEAELDEDLYRDIMKRLDIIIVQAERQALSEGYKFAKESRYKFESEEAFDKYLEDRIKRGEDYKEHNRELYEELEGQDH